MRIKKKERRGRKKEYTIDVANLALKKIKKKASDKELAKTIPPDRHIDAVDGKDRNKNKLSLQHKLAIIRWFAAGYSTREIRDFLKPVGIESITIPCLYYYKDRYRERITELRKEIFGEDFAHIPIAQKEIRLARYENLYHTHMTNGQLFEATNILERARVEIEGRQPLMNNANFIQGNMSSETKVNVINLDPSQKKQIDTVFINALERQNSG